MSGAETEREYVLGTGDDELARLGVQHRVWADAAAASWKRAGIGPGHKVLDAGCGPGYGSFDLGHLVTHTGLVLGVDESARFVEYVNRQAKARGDTQVAAMVADVQALGSEVLGHGPFDAAYARWTLCWLPHPERAVEGVARALKPGGRFVVQDYFNWGAMTMMPRSRAVDRLIDAALGSFLERHGDMELGGRVPGMFKASGLRLEHVEAHHRVVRGGGKDSTLSWPMTWWRTYGPKLVSMGRLSGAECEAALADLSELEQREDVLFVCPTVFEFIGVRARA